jgi:hypothetical protein
VPQGNGLDPEAAGGKKGLFIVVTYQTEPIEILKPLVELEDLTMHFVTVQQDPAPAQEL